MEEKAKEKKAVTLTVKVRLEQAEKKELPEVMVYAFDAAGQFLAAAPLPKGEQGQVKLELPSKLTGTAVRVLLGPPETEERDEVPEWMAARIRLGEGQKRTPSLSSLLRKEGYEKRLRLEAKENVIDISVHPGRYQAWFFCPCVVQGRLVKRVPLPDGTTQELGVCHACVKIYEVDNIPKIIARLPERDLYRLRDDLRRVLIEKPLPEHRVATPAIPLPPPPPPELRAVLKAGTAVLPQGSQVRADLDPVFSAVSSSQLRAALIAKVEIVAVHFCALDWLWYWFHTDLIKCCCTDEQGRFQTTIWYRCSGDKPDLYFKAVQCIGGTLHTLYDPGVACHTHWNYVCGTEVVLETDDPAAITCVPPDLVEPPLGVSLWVMPYGVGGVRLDCIKSSGKTDFSDGDGTWEDAPFGGWLGFRHGYSSDIPYDVAGKPSHYRWLYNKLDINGNETDWREFAPPVAETMVRHFVDYDLAHPELPPTFPAYPLGPQEKNSMHLYQFKPHQPPALPGHKREWPVDDWFADIYSGILKSENLPSGVVDAAGKYKIKIEIYDKNAALITPGPSTFEFIVPTGVGTDGVTILTRKAYASEEEGGGFIFYLHVDNNKCEAEIYDASVKSVPAGLCGFISYATGDDVYLSFKAKHPNGFGRFKFTVVRGSSGYVTAACAPASPGIAWANAPLVTDTIVNGFTRDAASIFTKDVDESDMRGGCLKAAFGENLYVKGTATNGWVRLSGLDAYALPKAFALEPETK